MNNRSKYILGFTTLITLVVCATVRSVAPVDGSGTDPRPQQVVRSGSDCSAGIFVKALPELGEKNIALVRKYAEAYGVDFRLILALMKQESQFREDAVSERGAVGLMQMMPVTHLQISSELEIAGGKMEVSNLEAGVYYFSKLATLFSDADPENRIRLALAAYNAGPSRVYDAQEIAAYLGEDPHEWSSIENSLPLLSMRYYSLHHAVWTSGRPNAGYYGSWRQTTTYVERIMKTYKKYCSIS